MDGEVSPSDALAQAIEALAEGGAEANPHSAGAKVVRPHDSELEYAGQGAERRASFFPETVGRAGRRPIRRAKADKEEARRRVRVCVLLLIEGRTKGYIKAFFKKHYGLKWRQTERYASAARRQIQEAIGIPLKELVAESYGFYMSILQQEAVPAQEKIRARELADKLLGLQAPHERARTEGKAEDLPMKAVEGMTDAELRALEKAGERFRELAAGNG